MAEPSLTQVFGPGATQTATTLTIAKADWVAVGLTPRADNSPESLLVAAMLFAGLHLTEANLNSNPDQSLSITDGGEFLTQRNNQRYRQKTKSLNMQKLDDDSGIDPDDY